MTSRSMGGVAGARSRSTNREATDDSAAGNGADAAFADARAMHAAALACLTAGDIRDAAEKAWCATKGATDGLIVARTGEAPMRSSNTTRELRRLGGGDPSVGALVNRYFAAQSALHGECFYLGLCEPIDDTERLINETKPLHRRS